MITLSVAYTVQQNYPNSAQQVEEAAIPRGIVHVYKGAILGNK